jgi:hypothetical protein
MKMKKYLLVAILVLSSGLFAQGAGQGAPQKKDFTFIPREYNAIAATGDSLFTDKIADINTLDTSRGIILDGWSQVHLVLTQKTGTAGGIIVRFQGSTDGVNYTTNLVTLDSLNWTAATAGKSFDLSQKCGGWYSVRLVFSGSTGPAFTGINTYSALIRKKP